MDIYNSYDPPFHLHVKIFLRATLLKAPQLAFLDLPSHRARRARHITGAVLTRFIEGSLPTLQRPQTTS